MEGLVDALVVVAKTIGDQRREIRELTEARDAFARRLTKLGDELDHAKQSHKDAVRRENLLEKEAEGHVAQIQKLNGEIKAILRNRDVRYEAALEIIETHRTYQCERERRAADLEAKCADLLRIGRDLEKQRDDARAERDARRPAIHIVDSTLPPNLEIYLTNVEAGSSADFEIRYEAKPIVMHEVGPVESVPPRPPALDESEMDNVYEEFNETKCRLVVGVDEATGPDIHVEEVRSSHAMPHGWSALKPGTEGEVVGDGVATEAPTWLAQSRRRNWLFPEGYVVPYWRPDAVAEDLT